MIEGVLRHCTDMDVEKQYTDSHGQSEVAFAFCRVLGFELLPRLKAIPTQRLYRPDDSVSYLQLAPVLSRTINWELIAQQYDQIIKYATAMRLGTADTEDRLLPIRLIGGVSMRHWEFWRVRSQHGLGFVFAWTQVCIDRGAYQSQAV